MATKKVRYVGGVDEMSLRLPDGQFINVQRNHQVEVPEETAKSLLEQSDWEKVDAPKKDEKPEG